MKHSNEFSKFMRNTVNLNQSRIETLSSRVKAIDDFLKNDDEKPAEPKPKMSAEDRRSARHGNRNNNSDISNSMIEEQKETNKLLKKMVNKDNNVMTGVQ